MIAEAPARDAPRREQRRDGIQTADRFEMASAASVPVRADGCRTPCAARAAPVRRFGRADPSGRGPDRVGEAPVKAAKSRSRLPPKRPPPAAREPERRRAAGRTPPAPVAAPRRLPRRPADPHRIVADSSARTAPIRPGPSPCAKPTPQRDAPRQPPPAVGAADHPLRLGHPGRRLSGRIGGQAAAGLGQEQGVAPARPRRAPSPSRCSGAKPRSIAPVSPGSTATQAEAACKFLQAQRRRLPGNQKLTVWQQGQRKGRQGPSRDGRCVFGVVSDGVA